MRRNTSGPLAAAIIFFILILTVFVHEATPRGGKNFLWRVQSKTNTVYILGSIHFLTKSSYPLNPAIEKAFEQSRVLSVEANISDTNSMDIQNLLGQILYPENDSLERHVSGEVFQLTVREAGKLGLPVELIQRQRPWFTALSFEAMALTRLGYDAACGIDIYFLSKAQGNKKIVELESVNEQINLMAALSESNQEMLLLYTIKNMADLNRYVSEIVRSWTIGDVNGLENLLMKDVREDRRFAHIIKKLLDDRNVRMVSRIEEYLRGRETHFVVVGAGHLVGEKGIINLLRQKGYKIQQF